MPETPILPHATLEKIRHIRGDVPALYGTGVAVAEGKLRLDGPTVAIVGTRKATTLGLALAEEFASELASRAVPIVSGGALGIDGAAHRGALAAGGQTIAVLPTPISRPYPLQHDELFARIVVSQGALLSEYADGAVDRRTHFVLRNDWIAALADAVVVVEAGFDSGALHTARAARRCGVPVAAVPWSLRHQEGIGCNKLIAEGAQLVTNASNILDVVFRAEGKMKSKRRPKVDVRASLPSFTEPTHVDEHALRIWKELRNENLHPEELALRTQLTLAKVHAGLLALELGAYVEPHGTTWRRTAP